MYAIMNSKNVLIVSKRARLAVIKIRQIMGQLIVRPPKLSLDE